MNLKKGLLANKYTPNPQYFPCGPSEIHVIPRENLIFLHDIGEGCFGKVYKGIKYYLVNITVYFDVQSTLQ